MLEKGNRVTIDRWSPVFHPYFYLPVNLSLSKISLSLSAASETDLTRSLSHACKSTSNEDVACTPYHKPSSKRITRVIIKLIESFIDNQFGICSSASKVSAEVFCRYFIDRCSLFFLPSLRLDFFSFSKKFFFFFSVNRIYMKYAKVCIYIYFIIKL